MKKHYEMRFSGSGGQGLMLLGDVLAQSAGCMRGDEVVLTKSYGPESRGGACRSELIIDTDTIGYPVVRHPDLMLAMSQKSCDAYAGDLDANGALLVDADLVKEIPPAKKVWKIPLTRIAEETTGRAVAANVVALGAIAVLSGRVPAEYVKEAAKKMFKPAQWALNARAFDAGVAAARAVL